MMDIPNNNNASGAQAPLMKGTVAGYEMDPLNRHERLHVELSDNVVVDVYDYKKKTAVTIFDASQSYPKGTLYDGYVDDIKVGTFGGVEIEFHTRGRWGKQYHFYCGLNPESPYELRRR